MTKNSRPAEQTKVEMELAALRRAGKKALQLAIAAGAPCYVMRGNRIVNIAKRTPKKATPKRPPQQP